MNGYGYQTRRRWLKTCMGIAGASLLAGCSGSDERETSQGTENERSIEESRDQDWPMYGVDLQNTGYHPDAEGPDGNELTERAIFDLKGISNYPVSVVDGVLYGYSTAGRVYAVELESETLKWDGKKTGPPIVHDGMLYGPTEYGTLYRYDLETGDQWESRENKSINAFQSYPVPTDKWVYIASEKHILRFDPRSGEYTTVIATPIPGRGTTNWPAFKSNTLYICRLTKLYAIDVDTPEIMWTFETETTAGLVDSNPTVANGMVYITSDESNLHAIDIVTGEEVWTTPTNNSVKTSPAFSDGIVYTAERGRVLAVDADTGDIEWEKGEEIVGTPYDMVIANGECFVTTRTGIRSYDASTGDLNWTYETPQEENIRFNAPPTIYRGVIYIPSRDETLYAIEDT